MNLIYQAIKDKKQDEYEKSKNNRKVYLSIYKIGRRTKDKVSKINGA